MRNSGQSDSRPQCQGSLSQCGGRVDSGDKTDGEVYFNGTEIFSLSSSELRKNRPNIQIIFQDPYSSLSPRLPVGEIIGEAVREHGLVPEDELDAYVTRIMKAWIPQR